MTQTDPRSDAPIIVVTRWTRYGKDRAYVAIDGTKVGYRDLHSGEITCETPGREATVAEASAELWRLAQAKRSAPRQAVAGQPARPQPTAELLPDRDLVANLPGAAVNAKARALRDQAPVRTRVDRILGRKTDERNWRIGGDAEEAVAKRLARLGPEWRVLHAIPVGSRGSDIDHLVIGPAGVFTVNAKNHPDANVWISGDTVLVNGHHQPYVRNSRHEAGRAARLLSARALFDVDVRGVVAIMGVQQGFTVVEQPRDGRVEIVMRKRIADHLRSLPTVLGPPSVDRIHAVARHLATWQPTTVGWSTTF